MNGKLVNQQNKKSQYLQNKIEVISQEIDKLEPFFVNHQKYLKSTFLALKYLEQKLDRLETQPLAKINLSLNNLEQKLTKKLLTTLTIILLAFSGLWTVFLINNKNSSCSQSKAENKELNHQNMNASKSNYQLDFFS